MELHKCCLKISLNILLSTSLADVTKKIQREINFINSDDLLTFFQMCFYPSGPFLYCLVSSNFEFFLHNILIFFQNYRKAAIKAFNRTSYLQDG